MSGVLKLGHSSDLSLSISSDGSRIAIASEAQLPEQVRILDLRNVTERSLQLPPRWFIKDLSWAAEGNVIFAVAGTHSTGPLIARIDLDGKTHILLERKSGSIGNPCPSPDGRHLAYYQQTTDPNVWLLENF